MKRFKRIICFVILLTICLASTGCSQTISEAVREAKQMHAVYGGKDDKSKIKFRGREYAEVEVSGAYKLLEYGQGYVTAPDVPALLCEGRGDVFSYTESLNVLMTSGMTKYSSYDYYNVFYVLPEFKDEFSEILLGGATEYCCLKWEKGERVCEILDSKTIEAIESTVSGNYYETFSFDTARMTETQLFKCDKTKTIFENSYEIHRDASGNLYLAYEYRIYPVAEQYKTVIEDITKYAY